MSEEKKKVTQESKETPKKVEKAHKNDSKKVDALLEELTLEKEKSLRIQAEMMNFKKRQEDLVLSIRKYANEDILLKLVGVIDNFERALSMENDDNKEFLKGFYMIYTSILNIITEAGVIEIDALDKPFDPNFHQAVLTEVKDGVDAGIVIDVLQKGYMYKDKVLRPSMVKVSE